MYVPKSEAMNRKIGMFKPKNKGLEEEKPIALKNYYTGEIHYDTLHTSVDRVLLMKLVLYCNRVKAMLPKGNWAKNGDKKLTS